MINRFNNQIDVFFLSEKAFLLCILVCETQVITYNRIEHENILTTDEWLKKEIMISLDIFREHRAWYFSTKILINIKAFSSTPDDFYSLENLIFLAFGNIRKFLSKKLSREQSEMIVRFNWDFMSSELNLQNVRVFQNKYLLCTEKNAMIYFYSTCRQHQI